MRNNLLIETSCGILQGYSEEGTDVFRGIPYAEPPLGNRRFRAPIPTKWVGIRDATTSGPAAYQVDSDNMEEVVDLAESLQSGELPSRWAREIVATLSLSGVVVPSFNHLKSMQLKW